MGATIMQSKLDTYSEKFNALPLRMRALLCFAGIVILYMLFDLFWYSSTHQAISQAEEKIVENEKQTQELLLMQTELNSNVSRQRNNPKTQKISQLESEIEKIKQQLTEKTVNLVPSNEMAGMLESIIDSTDSLKLISLNKQASTRLSEDLLQPLEQPQNISLYRHSVEIVLQGSYSATYEFLKNLENMERKVAFDSFVYQVKQYPNAEIRLVVSTLSLNKEWIGG